MEGPVSNTVCDDKKISFRNVSDIKMSWNMMSREAMCAVRKWKVDNETDYVRFKARIMHASYGDYSEYYKIFRMAVSCIPSFVMEGIRMFFDDTENIESCNPELDEDIAELVSSSGYQRFDKKKLDESCKGLLTDEDGAEIDLNGFDFEIVDKVEDDENYLYTKWTSTMEFWYNLPWDIIFAVRNFTPNKTEEQRAILTRTLYYKVLLSLDEIIENIETLVQRDECICNVLYFLIYDHGFRTGYRTIVHSLENENNIGAFRMIVSKAVCLLANISVNKGYGTKGEWKKDAKLLNDSEMRIALQGTIDDTRGAAGRPRTATNIIDLTDMLVGDLGSLMSLIKRYRSEFLRPVDLAYLFIILRNSGRITEKYYSIFHHAMESFEHKKYDLRNPQEFYNNFPVDEEILKKKGTSYQKRVFKRINEWTQRFRNQRLSV